jgi:N-acetylneuraminate synthase
MNTAHQNVIEINGRKIGPGHPTYIIAELSANHRQHFDEAVKLIHAAKESDADAVKLQTYTADTLTIDCDSELFRHGTNSIWAGRTLYDLYQEAFTPWDWQPKLKQIADDLGIDLFSTPFDPTAVDFLETMGVPAHKIASFEIVDLPLIQRIATTGKPMIMSTGMATLSEIDQAVTTAKNAGATQIALLKCTSAYPASPESMNLRSIPHLAKTFSLPCGLSDHTLGIAVPVAAVALGACIVEKHFTLSRSNNSADSAFSLEPHEFKAMATEIRTAEKALGQVCFQPTPQEQESRRFRRSLFVVNDIQAGELFTADNVRSIRPGHGLPPQYLPTIIGKRAGTYLKKGTPLTWDVLLGN